MKQNVIMDVKNKMYKIFFDDLRTVDMVYKNPEDWDFEVIRNIDDFKNTILDKGVPEFISFDHDLGKDDNGNVVDAYQALKWMVFDLELDLRNMDYKIHSANPLALEKIDCLIKNWNKELNRRENEQS